MNIEDNELIWNICVRRDILVSSTNVNVLDIFAALSFTEKLS